MAKEKQEKEVKKITVYRVKKPEVTHGKAVYEGLPVKFGGEVIGMCMDEDTQTMMICIDQKFINPTRDQVTKMNTTQIAAVQYLQRMIISKPIEISVGYKAKDPS